MPDNEDKEILEAIKAAQAALAEQKKRIDKLRRAGEDVTELDRQFQATKLRVDKWSRAFKD